MSVMMGYLLAGLLAGLAVAVPLGAIGLLVIRTGQARGLRVGLAAALGVATTDLVFAALAVSVGGGVAAAVGSLLTLMRIIAGAVLVLLGARELLALRRLKGSTTPGGPTDRGMPTTGLRAYLLLLGLTAANPLTIGYFASAAVGIGGTMSWGAGVLFVAGIFAASAGWQGLLVGVGAVSRKLMTPRAGQVLTAVSGTLMIVLGIYAASDPYL
ncbi:LysE family transporter [Micromonospora sp. NPDC049081]|uniref:LysE family transporter n=1 Tax=Micromonospora sp. NPDC049081 TaxID=3155150 RepID=UPI0033D97DDE